AHPIRIRLLHFGCSQSLPTIIFNTCLTAIHMIEHHHPPPPPTTLFLINISST
ncbi:hypothetical protein Sango_1495800, partial [Sesamum angolense]